MANRFVLFYSETGSIIITPIPGVTKTKPGSCTFPFFGIDLALLDPNTGVEILGNDVEGVLAIRNSFPSLARTVFNDHERYKQTYLNPFKGFYFTGDSARRDQDGYYWILGRVDDVINVSGHRLSTAEVESSLITHPNIGESAAIGVPDEITGEALVCFCTTKKAQPLDSLISELSNTVRQQIGAFAMPKRFIIVKDLPKTRSGKIMRRILRKVITEKVTLKDLQDSLVIKNKLGDTTALGDYSIQELVNAVNNVTVSKY